MRLDKDLYTIAEVAALFEVTKPTVYDWMNRRGLKWIQVGMRRRITRAAIEDFLRPSVDTEVSPDPNHESSAEAGQAEYTAQDMRKPDLAAA